MSTLARNNSCCLVCGRKVYFGEDTAERNCRKEIFSKFTTLVSRFLNFEPDNQNVFQNNASLKSSVSCSHCFSLVQAFCDAYKNWECLQLEMIHIVEKISNLLGSRSSSSSSNTFPKGFVGNVETKRLEISPFLRLEKLAESKVGDWKKNFSADCENFEDNSSYIQILPVDTKYFQSELSDDDQLETQMDSQFPGEVDFDNDYHGDEEPQIKVEDSGGFQDPLEFADDMDDNDAATGAFLPGGIQCGICGKVVRRMGKHMENKHSPKIAVCNICGKGFVTQGKLKIHQLTHSKIRSFKCDICQQRFKHPSSFRRHKKKIHGIVLPKRTLKKSPLPLRKCLVCEKIFPSPNHLETHFRSHTREKPFWCLLCSKEYSTNVSLMYHKKLHHQKNKPETPRPVRVQCEICGKCVFDLDRHHLRAQRCADCNLCGKRFASEYLLKRHQKNAHPMGRNFVCEICHSSYKLAANLKHHKLTAHSNTSLDAEQTVECDFCKLKFSTVPAMRIHKRNVHGVDLAKSRDFKCPYPPCEFSAEQKTRLDIHIRIHSGQRESSW